MPPRYYSGVGSRETPREILAIMTDLARYLSRLGYSLRSGGADGADRAFEQGAGDRKEIYLPWRGFNGSPSPLYRLTDEGRDLARRFHPRFEYLTPAAQKLMVRNGYQVLGYGLNDPSSFLVCWTPDGCVSGETRSPKTGGTGQAIAIAAAHGVTVFNLARPDHLQRILKKIEEARLR